MKQEKMYSMVEEWFKVKSKIRKEEFCHQHNVTRDTLGYWVTHYNKSKLGKQQNIIPVSIKSSMSTQSSLSTLDNTPQVELQLPSGIILKIY